MKILGKTGVAAIFMLALCSLFVMPAQAETGTGAGFYWQYDCGPAKKITAVVFMSADSPQNQATQFSLDNCAILVTMFSGNYIDGWDENSLALVPVLDIAMTLKVPIFYMRVDHEVFDPVNFGNTN